MGVTTDMDNRKMELGHEPVPGYRGAFFLSIAVAGLYLGIVLFFSL